MKRLFQEYGYPNKTKCYEECLKTELENLTGTDFSQFFDNYIYGTTPLPMDWAFVDSDGDGLSNTTEIFWNTNPWDTDTDGDGLTDFQETTNGTDPTDSTNGKPAVTSGSATDVGADSVAFNGTVKPRGTLTTYYFEYGTSTNYGFTTPVASAGSEKWLDVSVSVTITGLNPNTTYHYRLVGINSVGTGYGSDKTFTTTGTLPTVATTSTTSVTSASATLNGTVNPNGEATTYYFEYGVETSYGSTTLSSSAGSGTSAVSVIAAISELLSDTTYHYRLVATNSEGTSYGDDKTFSTVVLYVEPSGSCGGNTPCYSTIQNAIDSVRSGATIMIAQGNYDEDLFIETSNNFTLQGGWNSSFTSRSSTSKVNSMTFGTNSGAVTVEYLVVQ